MESRIGQITHYYNRIGVAVIVLSGELKVGDAIHILGHTTDFQQKVHSMEIAHSKVYSVGPGSEIALQVADPVRAGDIIYKIEEESHPH